MRRRLMTWAILSTFVFSGALSTGCHRGHGKMRQIGKKMLKHRMRGLSCLRR